MTGMVGIEVVRWFFGGGITWECRWPWRYKEWVVAADGKMAVRVHERLCTAELLQSCGPCPPKHEQMAEKAVELVSEARGCISQDSVGVRLADVAISEPVHVPCKRCNGLGGLIECDKCGGDGVTTCAECGNEAECTRCHGEGVVPMRRGDESGKHSFIECDACGGSGTTEVHQVEWVGTILFDCRLLRGLRGAFGDRFEVTLYPCGKSPALFVARMCDGSGDEVDGVIMPCRE